jgi:hypothetical protein
VIPSPIFLHKDPDEPGSLLQLAIIVLKAQMLEVKRSPHVFELFEASAWILLDAEVFFYIPEALESSLDSFYSNVKNIGLHKTAI